MEEQNLEQLLEYRHYNPGRPEFDGFHVSGEAVIQLGSNRIIYFWNVSNTNDKVRIVVPGILVRERHRDDSNGNTYSLVRPVLGEMKPGLEVAVWAEFIKGPDAIRLKITSFDRLTFDYWTLDDAKKQPG